MSHDVYVCYDEKDKEINHAICQVLEENKIIPWDKSKKMSSDDSADKIINAIEQSKCFILIFSKNSKDNNYVITETDIAFSRNIPIYVVNIDNSDIKGNLEFILEDQKKLPSLSNPKQQLKTLVQDVSNIMGKPVNNVKINSKSIWTLDKINPRKKENNVKKYAKIVIPIAVILILIYLFLIVPSGQHTTENGGFSMNVTDVGVSGLKYTVYGESFNLPSDSGSYVMNLKFFDEDDNLVFEVNSTADEFKSGIIWEGNLHSNNATHVEFKLTDLNGKEFSKQDYRIS